MTNKEIANEFALLGKVMELHDENAFKIRSYSNAYLAIRSLATPLMEMEPAEISTIRGVGKAISEKIQELISTGELQTLNKYLDKTPPGVIEMLKLKGFGPKKIKVIWKELSIESPGELLYACHENRLIELKGFGVKTQNSLIDQINYFFDSKGKFLFGHVSAHADELIEILQEELPDYRFSVTGEIKRKNSIVNMIEIITDFDDSIEEELLQLGIEDISLDEEGIYYKTYPVSFLQTSPDEYIEELVHSSSSETFRQGLPALSESVDTELSYFESLGMQYIDAEIREEADVITLAKEGKLNELITDEDIKGVVHTHTNYSDGQQTVEMMAQASQKAGYQYLVITDHSQSAFYAGGLKVDRVYRQIDEIDLIQQRFSDFKIFKGIESDILNSGELDYEDDVLQEFDVIIASVHSNLKMTEDKANARLIKAIENPFTTILGHPTGRLLLSRKGYPIDHEKVIDACAANGVSIELNANPRRLDIDYTWIPYAMKKGVLISINPDAHSIDGISDIKWGVAAARKGRLSSEYCLNAKDVDAFEKWITK